jgi:3-oxoacyl-[acyl-carrier protein] reductase
MRLRSSTRRGPAGGIGGTAGVGVLDGRVALVTGSSRGLGRAYALRLAEAGADVAVHDISADKLAEFGEGRDIGEVVDAVRACRRRSTAVIGDLTDPEAVRRIFDEVEAALGPLDIVVNNAGGDIAARGGKRPDPNDCVRIHPDDVRAVVERNLYTTIFCCREAAARMMTRRRGKIINISSMAGVMPVTEGAIYATAKAGIAMYTKSLALQLRPHDINVNCIAPGPTWTARFAATRSVASEEGKSRLQRIGQPEDLAKVVEFLAGPLSDHVSGQVIAVNGGSAHP